jgi:hypothetical protein
MRLKFSPAGPTASTAGRWVLACPPGASVFSIDTVPILVGPVTGHRLPDDLLAFPGGGAPQFQGLTLPDVHILVPDIDPDLTVRLSLDHDPVPPGKFEHGGKPAPEITPRKPADRPGLDPDTLDFRPRGTGRDQGAA